MSVLTLEAKLERLESATPWGFRMQGGKDFHSPLTIQRVTPGSLASKCGLLSGDIILKIGKAEAEVLKHKEAQDTIISCGNKLDLLLQRGAAVPDINRLHINSSPIPPPLIRAPSPTPVAPSPPPPPPPPPPLPTSATTNAEVNYNATARPFPFGSGGVNLPPIQSGPMPHFTPASAVPPPPPLAGTVPVTYIPPPPLAPMAKAPVPTVVPPRAPMPAHARAPAPAPAHGQAPAPAHGRAPAPARAHAAIPAHAPGPAPSRAGLPKAPPPKPTGVGATKGKRGDAVYRTQDQLAGRIPVCAACGTQIRGPFVLAMSKSWCPDHFVCANPNCGVKLFDIGFVEEGGYLYCEKDYEQFFAPHCSKCSMVIVGECVNALNTTFHPQCFVCVQCKKPMGNSSFHIEDGEYYCDNDWKVQFQAVCFGCKYAIDPGDRWVEALDHSYHSDCFTCSSCLISLEGQPFYAKAGKPYCKKHAR